MLDIAAQVTLLTLSVALLITFVRLVKGPTLPDRIVAMDLIGMLVVGLIVVLAGWSRVSATLDAAFVIALIVLRTTPGRDAFAAAGRGINWLLDFGSVGAGFVFGPLGNKEVWPRIMTAVLGEEGEEPVTLRGLLHHPLELIEPQPLIPQRMRQIEDRVILRLPVDAVQFQLLRLGQPVEDHLARLPHGGQLRGVAEQDQQREHGRRDAVGGGCRER